MSPRPARLDAAPGSSTRLTTTTTTPDRDKPSPARSVEREGSGWTDRPGFVLTMARYYGTLAAARCLGRAGVPLIVADDRWFAPALWSRHVVQREHCPPARDLDGLVDWLLAWGVRSPGHVLYATSDDLAWIFAERAAELRRDFRLLSPSFETVGALLDKRSLYELCATAGLRTPRTWFPAHLDDVAQVEREATLPLIVKPRTQVLFTTMRKGSVLTTMRKMRGAYETFLNLNRHDPRILERQPGVDWPMIQEFYAASDEPIYSLSGFADASKGLFVVRGSRKLVQWPRQAGVGICFEDAPVSGSLADGLRRLCELAGYVGVFEAEFIRASTDPRLIDFNPRFFGQMGFDVVRGLPGPLMVYLAATGDFARLRATVEAARDWRPSGPMRFANGTALAWTGLAERLVGHRPVDVGSDGVMVDFVVDRDDRLPGMLDSVQQVTGALRHARGTLLAAFRKD